MLNLQQQQTQNAVQTQVQRIGQNQIYSLRLLSMGSMDLRAEIFSVAAKNPALEITSDPFDENNGISKPNYIHTGKSDARGQLRSDNFQEALESKADERESLQKHLISQLQIMEMTPDERAVCTKLIESLDNNGFYTLAPVSLLDASRPCQTQKMLDSCIDRVRRMDPIGTCCTNIWESLYVQASLKGTAPDAALFILDGHPDFLDPPVGRMVLKKIHDFVKEQRKLLFNQHKDEMLRAASYTLPDIEAAIDFIRTLNPHPAGQFGTEDNAYIAPDVYVDKISSATSADNEMFVASNEGFGFKIYVANNVLPHVSLSKLYRETTDSTDAYHKKFISNSIADAKQFINSVKMREITIKKACYAIVKKQLLFFEKGPGHLVPLKQKDVALAIGVHETTISRMANNKFLQCQWGLFAIKYFFSSVVFSTTHTESAASVSKEVILHEITKILALQSADKKPLSDQKVADLLEAKGIKIARRTIAKYRQKLNISSSYTRPK